MNKPKYIFVTGGVTSSLGKGIISASLARLLQAQGLFRWRLGQLVAAPVENVARRDIMKETAGIKAVVRVMEK